MKNCKKQDEISDAKSLSELVKRYTKDHGDCLDTELKVLVGLKGDLPELSRELLEHPHQRRILNKKKIEKRLPDMIRKASKCKSFEGVKALLLHENRGVHGFSNEKNLVVYDLTMRIAKLYGMEEVDTVTVAAGAYIGAKRLGLTIRNGKVNRDELPPELTALASYHVENFLCVYNDRFADLKSVKKRGL